MSKKPTGLSRRDFLKVAMAGVGASILITLLDACGVEPDDFIVNREILPGQNYNPDTIIYKGRVMSVDDPSLDLRAKEHLSTVLNQIRQGVSLRSPAGLDPTIDNFDSGNILNFEKTTVFLDKTGDPASDSGQYLTQILIGRKQADGTDYFPTDKTSLLVAIEGNESNPAFFKNTKSDTTEIKVNTDQGIIYQIVKAGGGLFSQTEDTNISVSRMDLNDQGQELKPVFLPFSEEFINALGYFFSKLKASISPEKLGGDPSSMLGLILDYMAPEIFGEGSTRITRENVFKELNDYFLDGISQQDWQAEIIDRLDSYIPDVPLDTATTIGMMRSASGRLANISQLDFNQLMNHISPAISPHLPSDTDDSTASSNIESLKRIISREISIPDQLPELYFVPLVNTNVNILSPHEKKWALIAKYAKKDPSLHQSPLAYEGNFPDAGERVMIGVYYEDDIQRLFNDPNILKETNLPKDISTETVCTLDFDQGSNGLWTINDSVPSYMLNSEAMRLFWDPRERQVFAGVKYNNRYEDRVFEFRPGDFLNIRNREVIAYSNRWWPFLGENPYRTLDVTDTFLRLKRQGQSTVSPLAFSPGMDAITLAIGAGNGSFTQYDKISDELLRGSDNLPGRTGDQADSKILVPNGTEIIRFHRNWLNNLTEGSRVGVMDPLIFGAFRIMDVDGKKFIVIAEVDTEQIGSKNEIYTVPLESALFIDAKSNGNLIFDETVKILPWVLAAYKGYRIYQVPAVKEMFSGLGLMLKNLDELLRTGEIAPIEIIIH